MTITKEITSKMDFKTAINRAEYLMEGDYEGAVDLVIYFKEDNAKTSSASLTAKRFMKEKNETIETLERAWNCLCRENPEISESISAIEFRPAVSITQKYAKKRRLSA